MADRPEELEIVERLVASASFSHMFAFGLHRELVELQGDTDHTRMLLGESADIALAQMPTLERDFRALTDQWSEVQLLDPANLDSVSHAIEVRFAEVDPKLQTLIARHDEIIAELVALVRNARRS